MDKLALDHSKRMLHLGPDAGLELFDLVGHGAGFVFFVRRFAFAGAHGHVPGNVCVGIGSFFNALVTRITKRDALKWTPDLRQRFKLDTI
jgi:hypothetical protein